MAEVIKTVWEWWVEFHPFLIYTIAKLWISFSYPIQYVPLSYFNSWLALLSCYIPFQMMFQLLYYPLFFSTWSFVRGQLDGSGWECVPLCVTACQLAGNHYATSPRNFLGPPLLFQRWREIALLPNNYSRRASLHHIASKLKWKMLDYHRQKSHHQHGGSCSLTLHQHLKGTGNYY